jgi:hypothetical protein
MPYKSRVTKAKERENKRQAKYFKDDIVQPFDERGKPSRAFIKRYGTDIFNKKITKL